MATLRMLPEQRFEKFLTPAEIRCSEPSKRTSHVDHSPARGEVKNAKGPSYFESLSPCGCGRQ
jgi:hypothetical protein